MLHGLRAEGDEAQQLQALSELCEMLSMGTEESLGNLPCDTFIPALVDLLNSEWNPDLMLYACRAVRRLQQALHLRVIGRVCAVALVAAAGGRSRDPIELAGTLFSKQADKFGLDYGNLISSVHTHTQL